MIEPGAKFGHLTTLCLSHIDKSYRQYYWCECDCGTLIMVIGSNLKKGNTKSCGQCLRGKHNMNETRFYKIWQDMKTRCTNPKHRSYKNYGGRGIKICDKWNNFTGFLEDMYITYIEHYNTHNGDTSIDRINNNGDYEKENCRWTTNLEQQWNRSDIIPIYDKNLEKFVSRRHYCMSRGIEINSIRYLMKKGHTVEEAVSIYENRRLKQ